ncbi:MAG: SPFH domain-containing protein, partial [Desulfobacteraceae bacterium]|nr:SPFH domain-containing protein [Desulfobacteraceae bacterium]
MDDLIKQLKNLKLPGSSLLLVILVVAAIIIYSSFFTIDSGAVGVVQRFGKFVREADPGLNFKLPFGIEHVTKIPREKVFQEEFGIVTESSDLRPRSAAGTDDAVESLMLTGDLNVAVVPWIVQYRIKEPYDYLFKVKNAKNLLRDLSE